MVLFVEEDISVERQLKRGKYVEAHNRLFKQTGIGTPIEIRKTGRPAPSAAPACRCLIAWMPV